MMEKTATTLSKLNQKLFFSNFKWSILKKKSKKEKEYLNHMIENNLIIFEGKHSKIRKRTENSRTWERYYKLNIFSNKMKETIVLIPLLIWES